MKQVVWGNESNDKFKKTRYKRIWVSSVLITVIVSISPLLIMTVVNYIQYQRTLKDEIMYPMHRFVSTTKHALEYSLEERKNALIYIVEDKTVEELSDEVRLNTVIKHLDNSFKHYVDLALIDNNGEVLSYVGPYSKKLIGVNYADEKWFNEVQINGVYISDVFLGFRQKPHFVIAVRHVSYKGVPYVLRATINMDILTGQIPQFEKDDSTDAFIINTQGILQTNTRFGKRVLEKSPVPVPERVLTTRVVKMDSPDSGEYILSYAYIVNTPFIFIITRRSPDLMRNWLNLRNWLIGFLLGSIVVIVALTMAISSVLVTRIREADERQDKALHKIEYSSKMASIGRLAAGVAHEINNPLAIINEKAGLMQDLIAGADDFVHKEKFSTLLDSIINSVERCSAITHRLLGFAKHFDVSTQTIDLVLLIKEVLGFLEKEASFRNIQIQTFFQDDLPSIKSDKGQLQQVFLNLLNNSLEAVERGGRVGILVEQREEDSITIVVSDNGPGISENDLDHIFEPFYTTKNKGTGLGLSITYGIIKKLKGKIEVESDKERGTSFTLTLPITAQH